MEHGTDTGTVFIVDGDPAFSLSAKYLLEARYSSVELYPDARVFVDSAHCTKSDTVLLDLDPHKPLSFRLFNQLIFSPQRPHIVVMTRENSALKSDDVFPGEGIKVLTHPVIPEDLVKAVTFS